MRRNKKGQTIGQVFIYIMAIIVFATILIFGYKIITEFIGRGERVAFVTFKTDLEKAVKGIYFDYGSVRVYNLNNPLRVPSRYEEICFVNLDKNPDSADNIVFQSERPLAYDAWKTAFEAGGWERGEQNVFLRPLGEIAIKVYKITIDIDSDQEEDDNEALDGDVDTKGFLCFNVTQGRVDLRLEGMGDHAFISRI